MGGLHSVPAPANVTARSNQGLRAILTWSPLFASGALLFRYR
jgi:hypothetical protein